MPLSLMGRYVSYSFATSRCKVGPGPALDGFVLMSIFNAPTELSRLNTPLHISAPKMHLNVVKLEFACVILMNERYMHHICNLKVHDQWV